MAIPMVNPAALAMSQLSQRLKPIGDTSGIFFSVSSNSNCCATSLSWYQTPDSSLENCKQLSVISHQSTAH
jgi:hypothetical protein